MRKDASRLSIQYLTLLATLIIAVSLLGLFSLPSYAGGKAQNQVDSTGQSESKNDLHSGEHCPIGQTLISTAADSNIKQLCAPIETSLGTECGELDEVAESHKNRRIVESLEKTLKPRFEEFRRESTSILSDSHYLSWNYYNFIKNNKTELGKMPGFLRILSSKIFSAISYYDQSGTKPPCTIEMTQEEQKKKVLTIAEILKYFECFIKIPDSTLLFYEWASNPNRGEINTFADIVTQPFSQNDSPFIKDQNTTLPPYPAPNNPIDRYNQALQSVSVLARVSSALFVLKSKAFLETDLRKGSSTTTNPRPSLDAVNFVDLSLTLEKAFRHIQQTKEILNNLLRAPSKREKFDEGHYKKIRATLTLFEKMESPLWEAWHLLCSDKVNRCILNSTIPGACP